MFLPHRDLSLSCFPTAKTREQNTAPELLSVTESPRWHTPTSSQPVLLPLHSTLLSMTQKTLSNWPWLFQISLHCPCLYLQGCVWCFLEGWKSYRSSLNLRGQAKQTGREQNSSGCLTHTGFEIICRLHYLFLNMHIVCTPSVYWFQRHAVKQICLGVNTSTIKFSYNYSKLPSSYNINANKQTNSPLTPQSTLLLARMPHYKGTGSSTASLLAKQHSH